jgi:hypothetical protein
MPVSCFCGTRRVHDRSPAGSGRLAGRCERQGSSLFIEHQFAVLILRLGGRMTGDKFRAKGDECIKAANSVADPVRKDGGVGVPFREIVHGVYLSGEPQPTRGGSR